MTETHAGMTLEVYGPRGARRYRRPICGAPASEALYDDPIFDVFDPEYEGPPTCKRCLKRLATLGPGARL